MKNEKMVFKSVVKAKDMDEEMFVKIEKWARETFEDSKVKYKDEMVNFYFNIIFNFRKLLIT
jgi:predicted sulfurtransferase